MISLNIDGKEVRISKGDYGDVELRIIQTHNLTNITVLKREEALALAHALELYARKGKG